MGTGGEDSVSLEPTLTVPHSGARDYPIYIGAGTLTGAGEVCASVARSRRAVIITQPRIGAAYGETITRSLEESGFGPVATVTFPAGERYKTLATMTRLCDGLYNLSPAIDRKTLVV